MHTSQAIFSPLDSQFNMYLIYINRKMFVERIGKQNVSNLLIPTVYITMERVHKQHFDNMQYAKVEDASPLG